MLPMPKIERRQIDRLKSNRSLKVHKSKAGNSVEQEPKNLLSERRSPSEERREVDQEVAFERRRSDRRRAFLRNSRQMREILSNSGVNSPTPASRQGMFIDEEV